VTGEEPQEERESTEPGERIAGEGGITTGGEHERGGERGVETK